MAKKTEKRSRYDDHKNQNKGPNNLLIALLIFGTLALMFGVVWGINYSKLTKNIETYMEDMGGEDLFGDMEMDSETRMSVTAKGNKMEMTTKVTTDDAKAAKKQYTSKAGVKETESAAAYYLYMMKSGCRGLTASIDYKVLVNKKEVQSGHISYHKAKRILKKAGMIE